MESDVKCAVLHPPCEAQGQTLQEGQDRGVRAKAAAAGSGGVPEGWDQGGWGGGVSERVGGDGAGAGGGKEVIVANDPMQLQQVRHKIVEISLGLIFRDDT